MTFKENFEKFFETVPPDPYEGMVKIFDWFDDRVKRIDPRIRDNRTLIQLKAACLGSLSEWLRAHNIKIQGVKFDTQNISYNYSTLKKVVDNYRPQVEFKRQTSTMNELIGRKNKDSNFLELTKEEKEKIRKHLDFIQNAIDDSRIDVRKKNVLNKKLGQLRAEIERAGTNLDVLMGGMVLVSTYLGQMAENTKPVFERAKDIVDIVQKVVARQENIKLPVKENHNLLENQIKDDED